MIPTPDRSRPSTTLRSTPVPHRSGCLGRPPSMPPIVPHAGRPTLPACQRPSGTTGSNRAPATSPAASAPSSCTPPTRTSCTQGLPAAASTRRPTGATAGCHCGTTRCRSRSGRSACAGTDPTRSGPPPARCATACSWQARVSTAAATAARRGVAPRPILRSPRPRTSRRT